MPRYSARSFLPADIVGHPSAGDAWQVVLDPASLVGGPPYNRSALSLNSGPIRVDQKGIDWGDSQIQIYLADRRVGSTKVDFRIPNRKVTIPLFLGADESGTQDQARAQLQQKVGLIQMESGWLMRQRANGLPMYADIIDAVLTLPDVWGESGGIEPNVVLILECSPDFYGDEIPLDAQAATGHLQGPVTNNGVAAVILGDHPGRVSVDVQNTAFNDQRGLLWGFRARYYDPATTAQLVYQAEQMTPVNGAAAVTTTVGASGKQFVQHSSLPVGVWVSILSTDLPSGGPLTHIGSYRVWARCYSATASPSFRFLWGVGSLVTPVVNDAIQLPGSANFYLVDLGEVRLDRTPTENFSWHGVIQVQAAKTGDPCAIDAIYFQPLDESAGRLGATTDTGPVSSVEDSKEPSQFLNNTATAGVAWSTASSPYTVTLTSLSQPTNYLQVNFAYTIPSSASIKGIRVSIAAYSPAYFADQTIRLVRGGTIASSNLAQSLPAWTGWNKRVYGSPTALWGINNWSAADFNNFGVVYALTTTNMLGAASATASVYNITMDVFYTLASGFSVSQDAVIYGGSSAKLAYNGIFRADPTGTYYGPMATVIGDLPHIPPSGYENRIVELFMRPTRGALESEPDTGGEVDTFVAQVKYRPVFIHRS